MNSREKVLLGVLVLIVGFGAILGGGFYWFIVPFRDYNKRIAALQDDKDKSRLQWEMFVADQSRLEAAKLRSLPANAGDAQSEYIISYLEPLCEKSGLTDVNINHTPATEVKVVAPIPNVKKVGHQLMSFTVRARGELGALVKVLEAIQKTPYEHRIKSLNLDRFDTSNESNPKLGILLTIETLLVAKTPNKPGRVPGLDASYPLNNRVYADIARKNIFVGAIPEAPTPPVTEKKSPGNIPAYVRLVQTVPDQKEAYLLNLFSRNEEIKLIADPRSGYEVQAIADWDTSYTFCVLKALRVDTRVVYFQVRDQVYRIDLGQTLADALKYPLSIEQLDVLDLEADREWGKQQIQGKTATKTKGGNKR